MHSKNEFPPVTIIKADELETIDSKGIGSGVFSDCFIRKFKRLGINVVEKQIPDADIDMLYREARYLQLFSHSCIPHLFGVKIDEIPLAIIIEFIGEGIESLTVHKLLFSLDKIRLAMSSKSWLSICCDITEALDHIHKKGFLHCDLKTDNVLVSRNKGYVIDFGKLQQMAHPCAKEYKRHYERIAPEVLKGGHVNSASDVYSLGRIMTKIGKVANITLLKDLGRSSTNPDPKERPALLSILTI